MRILCASRRMDGTLHIWVGKLSRWGNMDYVASMARGMSGGDEDGLRSLHLYHEDITDLVVVATGGEQE